MIELLALPGWQSPPRTLEEWVDQLSAAAGRVEVTQESSGVAWLEIASLRLRGYAVIDGAHHVEAINFEPGALDPEPATRAVEDAATALGWEVDHDPDDSAEDGDDED